MMVELRETMVSTLVLQECANLWMSLDLMQILSVGEIHPLHPTKIWAGRVEKALVMASPVTQLPVVVRKDYHILS